MLSLRRPARLVVVVAVATVLLSLHAIAAAASPGTTQTTSSSTTNSSTLSRSTTATTSTLAAQTTPPTSTTATTTATTTTTQSSTATPDARAPTFHAASPAQRAHAAGDPSETIVDFKFSPATVTVHVGDTITWTNQGNQPHTATANDGSFNTGTLHTGQSASHTFTKAGTFAYICAIHPFMHGTVVVEASSSGGGSGSGSAGGAGSAGGSASSSGSGTSNGSGTSTGSISPTSPSSPVATSATATPGLPNTGLDLGGVVIAALVMIGAGILLRRQLS